MSANALWGSNAQYLNRQLTQPLRFGLYNQVERDTDLASGKGPVKGLYDKVAGSKILNWICDDAITSKSLGSFNPLTLPLP